MLSDACRDFVDLVTEDFHTDAHVDWFEEELQRYESPDYTIKYDPIVFLPLHEAIAAYRSGAITIVALVRICQLVVHYYNLVESPPEEKLASSIRAFLPAA